MLAERAGDRLYLPLPHGTHVNRCANVLAAGVCTVDRTGETLTAVAPEIVPASEAAASLRSLTRPTLGLDGTEHYLRFDVVG